MDIINLIIYCLIYYPYTFQCVWVINWVLNSGRKIRDSLHVVNELMAGSESRAAEKPDIHPAFQVC